jgi:hypothetical protein
MTYEQANAATSDAVAPASVGTAGVSLYNGTTFDRLRGSNGAANVGVQNAFSLYSETAVVDGARITAGNTAAGSISNQAQWALVSVNLSVLTGTSVTYNLQVQDTNGNWVTIGSTGALTATGMATFSVGPGMANGALLPAGNGQFRVSWTVNSVTHVTSQIGVTGR